MRAQELSLGCLRRHFANAFDVLSPGVGHMGLRFGANSNFPLHGQL